MAVPFVDLKIQYRSIEDEVIKAIKECLTTTTFILGPKVKEFEENFAKYCGTKYTIAVSNGTDAIMLALKSLKISRGDEVIIPANTFIATAEAISHCGATPVLVDIEPDTYLIDPNKIKKAITKKTKAIIPVHLYGQMADMERIITIAKKHRLYVIEDACQAHGATYKRQRAGSLGDIGCFSFYPTKNLGAYGEGGACTTNNESLNKKIRLLRDHGSEKKYYHEIIGHNCRMHAIQGAILNIKLKYLSSWNSLRRKNAKKYEKFLKRNYRVTLPKINVQCDHVFHLYVIQVDNRDKILEQLNNKGISALIHYPIPIHLQKAYEKLGYKEGSFPVTEKAAKRILSLPMYPEMTVNQLRHVSTMINRLTQ